MLIELRVQNLGVIENTQLIFGSGLSALTGETGAGKTLVTEAISLLSGARSDSALVRPGSTEASVEGRFLDSSGNERVAKRVVPAEGRSRAYLDGSLCTSAQLETEIGSMIALHGQHGQLALLRPSLRRDALDQYGQHDLTGYEQAKDALIQADSQLSELGGDSAQRAREIDLLRFQIQEIQDAQIVDGDEDERLSQKERVLGDAGAHIDAAQKSIALICADGPVADALGETIALLEGRSPFTQTYERLVNSAAEIADIADELRDSAAGVEDDPEALAQLQQRRELLSGLRRKYGPELKDVLDFWAKAQQRLELLEDHDRIAAELDAKRAELVAAVEKEASKLKTEREKSAKKLGEAIVSELAELALPRARLVVNVEGEAGSDVDFLIAMNPGSGLLPIAKAASGGELSRVMLALTLVVGTPALLEIYDEVDAGVGGQAATAIGSALAKVARERQVLVVTHLAQVAAFADNQIGIAKSVDDTTTTTNVTLLSSEERTVELARMLSGTPDSASALAHAKELLKLATRK